MHASPRLRRLRNDLSALEQLRGDSSIFSFTAQGDPPNHYRVALKGRGLWQDRGQIRPLEIHRVEIKLGASYPRTMPEIRWITPIYHPNISEIGMVCLGGYGTHWVPSIQLDELCVMLWDMARFHNYDIRSPYNRDSALWAANQTAISFPTDSRPLRDLRAAMGRVAPPAENSSTTAGAAESAPSGRVGSRRGISLKLRGFALRYGSIFNRSGEDVREAGAESVARAGDPPPAEARPGPRLPFETPAGDDSISDSASGLIFQDVLEQPEGNRSHAGAGDEEIFFIG